MIFKKKQLFSALLILLCFSACEERKAPDISFYYWKTKFALNPSESQALRANEVTQLYVRYFDIEVNKMNDKVQPVGVIQFNNNIPVQKIIPVIYIKNEVFEKETAIDSLCEKVSRLSEQISNTIHQNPDNIQFDCDWTLRTKEGYFHFLKTYKSISKKQLSATIRLHQIKHRLTTGVPPVDFGVLMFYNMGNIDASENNSIFDAKIARSYLGNLSTYPLQLDIALPVFSWSIQIRNGKVIHLLNKMSEGHFNRDPSFQKMRENRYKAIQSCFKGGYYFQQNDEIKTEQISEDDLSLMADLLSKKVKTPFQQIIFYDLDSINLSHYSNNIYEKISHLFN